MNIYCDRCAMKLISTVFLFDGRRLQVKQSLDEVIYSLLTIYSGHYYFGIRVNK
ncbi:hypothetical protein ACJIZ3_019667 [Penstemon smallii]|uniref:Uncharacterized protein n=1 Tax=Penstemon smallii TaxID=265156 RepID=A0ABD3T2C0_9LAMI